MGCHAREGCTVECISMEAVEKGVLKIPVARHTMRFPAEKRPCPPSAGERFQKKPVIGNLKGLQGVI